MPRINKAGYTLIEILITLIIIGILVAVALPNYTKMREHALSREAIASLKLIGAAQKIYKLEIKRYFPIPEATTSDTTDINRYLRLTLDNKNWDYSVTGSASDFNVTATKAGAAGCQYTYNKTDMEQDQEPRPSNCP